MCWMDLKLTWIKEQVEQRKCSVCVRVCVCVRACMCLHVLNV